MKAFRHKRGSRKAFQRKLESTSKPMQVSKNGLKRFRMETLESRILLSDTSLPMLALDVLNDFSAPPEAALVLNAGDSPTVSSTDTNQSPTSKEGQTLDVAFNDALGEMLLANNSEIVRLDPSTKAILGSFDIPGSDFTTELGLQILPAPMASLGGTAVDAGSLLVTNGTTSFASIFAVNGNTGVVLASLNLGQEFDAVAGAFDPGRGTVFVLDASSDRIVEMNPADGAVVNAFAAPFAIGAGGLTIDPISGNLWIGSDQSNSLAEMTPEGSLVRLVEVTSAGIGLEISGLAFKGNDFLISSTRGNTFQIHDPAVSLSAVSGNAGTTVTIAVNISDTTGLESVDIGNFNGGLPGITYDTTLLDATNASVKAGTVYPGQLPVANVIDATGQIFIAFATASAPALTSGTLFFIDFQIKPGAASGTTRVDLRNVSLNEGGLVVSPLPLPGTDSTDGIITIGSVAVNQPPVVNDQTFSLAENSANATTVGTIAATDPDAGQTLTFTVTGGTGQTAFAVSAAGIITVTNSAALNFEATPSFTLNVTVTDNGAPALNDTAIITINLTNVNEAPVVDDQTFTLAENSANGTAVGTVVATDPDAGQTRTFTVTGGSGQAVFAVSAAGIITVANSAALNFETTPSFTLNVTVTDNGAPALNDTAIITINLTNVNEAPVVDDQTFTVAENATNGTAVGTIVATDPDAGQTRTFTVTGGTGQTVFAVNAAGIITVSNSAALNFETTPSFTLNVTVTDNGVPALNDTAIITINLTNVNEAPVVDDQTFTLAENSTNGTAVGTIVATDPDAGQTRTFSLTGGSGQTVFAVSAAGIITVTNSAALNFEATPSFTLNVTVTDNGTPALNDTAIITINLTNVNEAPVVDDQTFSVASNAITGAVVGTVVATDPDAGSVLAYSISGGNTNGAFALNGATGQITVANAAQLLLTGSFAVAVTVTDNGTPALNDTAVITINVTNVNQAPVVNDQTFAVAENATNGTAVGTIVATDPDAGQTRTFSVTGGSGQTVFAVSAAGIITVTNSAALNFETTPSFTLNVTVTDNGVPALNDTAVITINLTNTNEAPVVDDQTFTVAENATNGTAVGTIVATDPDAGQTRTFTVTGGSGQAVFAVSAAGIITVSNSAALNFETTPSFTLNVTVTDNGVPALNDTAIITINLTNVNEAPVVDDQTFTVAENATNGTAVGTIVATDPDAGQTRTFTVTGGSGQAVFAVGPAGIITVTNSAALNFETSPSFTLNVTVTDNGAPVLNDTAVITINLTNVNEAPVVDDQTFTVAENSANGTAVGTIVATDPDAGQTRTFTVTGGSGQAVFAVSAAGIITVTNSAALNFETTPSFTLNVTATDNGVPALNDTAIITINLTNVNEAPVVDDQTFTLAENSANGTAVGTIVATDPDAGQTRTFSLTGGSGQTVFAVSAAGIITVTNSAALNFETSPSFTLNVTVTDNGAPVLNDTAVITINLTNVNEAPVVDDQTFSVASNAITGAVVGTVVATDPDAGSVLAYSISGGNTNGAFALNGATGQITVANAAQLLLTGSFAVAVTVTDNGTPALNDTAVITINVTNVNQAPVVNDQTFAVAENATNGTAVGTIVATDPDAGQTRTFSVTGGSGQTVFAVSAAGIITVTNSAALNFEATPSFTLNVTVTDNGVPALNDTAIISINLTNVNEAPVVDDQTFTVAENATNGTAVGTIVATDPDAGQTRTFTVTGGSGQAVFAVSAAGIITVSNSAALNFETTPSFTLNVTVTDNGVPALNDTAIITINLTNVNEAPVVDDQTFTVAENATNGTAVGTIVATDPDAGQTRTFTVTGGSGQAVFAVGPAGIITVTNSAALNFETTPSFTLNVTVTDNGAPALNDTAIITINLTNVNEAPVVDDQTFTVAENATNGTAVGTIVATDPDAGQTRTFTVTGGSGQAVFAVGSAGIITVTNSAALNFETTPSFTLNVTLTDNGAPVLNDTAVITINLTNINEAPVVDDQTFTLAENSANGTAVGTIVATDPDAGQTRTFSLTGGSGQTVFAVSAAGIITVTNSAALNFETSPSFTLNVTVTDNGAPVLNDTAVITINLTNVNEAPVVDDQTFSVASNAITGAVVGTVVATDPDAGSVLAYSISGGNTNGAFALNGATGQITVANAAQLLLTGSFAVAVTVTDNGTPALNDTAVITINVTNVNQAPVVNDQTFAVAENATNGTAVGTIVATDPDAGQTRTFSVTGGSGQAVFTVGPAGIITVTNSVALNFETTPSFTLNVTVTDNGVPALNDTAIITINLTNTNEAPVVDDQTFTVAENATNGTAVGTIVATDPDAGQTRTFTVTGGSGQTVFAVGPAGIITVTNSAALNFETTPSFTLNVTVTDNGAPALNDTAIITINLTNVNEAPVVDDQTFTVAENATNGTAVGTIVATDPDAGQTRTFTVTGGSGQAVFAVGPAGIITVTNSAALNFETTPSFTLNVTVTDNGTPILSDTAVITINLTNINEAPVVDDQTFTVAENATNGTAVGTIVATDPDAGQTRTFTVTGGSGQAVFAVSAAGIITVTNSVALNFETTPSFTLNVTVTDNGTPILSDTAVITINLTNINEAPVVNDQTFTVAENTANGAIVDTIVATDPDAGQTRTFSVTGGSGQTVLAVSAAGVITVTNSAALNFETTPSFTLNVTVIDSGTPGLSDTAIITINLTNVNEAPVVNDQTFTIGANATNGTAVGTIVATDPDSGQARTFTVTGGTGQAAFAVSAAGLITVADATALPGVNSFTLNVTVTDNGTPALSDTAVITIVAADSDNDGVPDSDETGDTNADGIPDAQQATVGSVLDFTRTNRVTFVTQTGVTLKNLKAVSTPPSGPSGVTFPFGFFVFDLVGVAAGGTAIVQVLLPDTANPNTFWKFGSEPGNTTPHFYEFLFNGTTGATFEDHVDIDPTAGTQFMDRINLTFVDGLRGDNDLTANGTITDPGAPGVQVVNHAPVVNDQTFTVAENTANGAIVGTIVATDPDAGQTRTFSVTGGTGQTAFAVSAAGVITVANSTALNFETTPSFTLNVMVTDNGTPAMSDTAVITINLTNVNEAPVITSNGGGATAAINVPENNTAVTIVTVDDPDAGTSLAFSLSGTDADKFVLTGTGSSRVIFFIAPPDFEAPTDAGHNNVYDVSVQVSDGLLSDSQAIAVTVTDVNETVNKAPVAANDTATTDLNTPVVISVLTNDTDDGTLVLSSVAIGTDPTNGSVSVNSTTGKVTYTPALGFFGVDTFTYTVKDNTGLVSNIATVTVNVQHDATKPVAQLLTDPSDPTKTVLFVMGTNGKDKIRLSDDHHNGIEVKVNDKSLGTFKPTGRIVIFGLGGNDDIHVDEHISLSAEIYGNDGNDKLFGGSGDDTLFGGNGNDKLFGRKGEDQLFGGPGNDKLFGGQGKDELDGGLGCDLLIQGGDGLDGSHGNNGHGEHDGHDDHDGDHAHGEHEDIGFAKKFINWCLDLGKGKH